ncbi:hypothetical protein OG413_34470 [Streptomyces sp. NBC_01433]|uniref:hypothetical protein n=1 Tax=Streptomyces sp. NBC_01433 TaxID=2903864 RepID=UPI002259C0B4|nr:hypothetical protein [Streptomyces sp. NBC_01433]MCX4680323.1 hypothetical protein [Streptomyces sp. NBC_01433]
MTDDVRNIVLGVIAAGISACLGWLARTHLWRRRLRRKQAFFGLPGNSECLLVVNRFAGAEGSVHRHDTFALLELSALIKDCSAHARILSHDVAQQGFGERTEFCIGGPVSNQRMAAHLHSLLPGVKINTDPEPSPDRASFQVGPERYRLEPGVNEYVLLARLTGGQGARPVFLFCGQRAITNQAATRYLARNHEKLWRRHGNSSFCLLLKVTNSQAYGPDVVELVGDVTRAAQEPVPAPRTSHRATG